MTRAITWGAEDCQPAHQLLPVVSVGAVGAAMYNACASGPRHAWGPLREPGMGGEAVGHVEPVGRYQQGSPQILRWVPAGGYLGGGAPWAADDAALLARATDREGPSGGRGGGGS